MQHCGSAIIHTIGSGMEYIFLKNSYQRAYDWAERNSNYKEPAVLGAVIDLGYPRRADSNYLIP